ncbi:MAG TPA: CHAD domain-containing protein [Burkholderiales bacterium]|nr:CHAD domain-containing protein [Burkholderiales bacterium]
MQIEREIKFTLTPEAARRVVRQVRRAGPWRRRMVSNAYYDTANEQLRRAGVALRLRRDGRRRLQTLKVEADGGGLSTRAEWELPAPGGRLDVAAFPREEILAATGLDVARLARKLQPRFETRFARRSAPVIVDGATRAEISIDRGYVAAGERREPISEVELELKAGDTASLLRYAGRLAKPLGLALEFESKAERGYRLVAGEDSPLPRKWRRPKLAELATPSEAFHAIFTAALTQAGANARGVAHGRDPEYLHQMRVGLRRLRSALLAFRDLVPKKAAQPLAQRLRGLMPHLGAARDWDVFTEGLVHLGTQEPERAPLIAPLLALARAKRGVARRRARMAAASPGLQSFMLRALRWVNAAPWKDTAESAEGSLGAFAAAALDRVHRKSLAQAQDIDWADAERRHRLRICMKRLRYACDFFASSFAGAAARPYIKRLAALQDILGELNDIAVARRLLAELVPRGSARDVAAAAGHVRHALAVRERMLVMSLEPAWAAFEKRRPFWKARA